MKLSEGEIVSFFLALAALLATARVLGEIARKFNQPSVLGELLAGVFLGPTLLGQYWPAATEFLFNTGHVPLALNGLTTLAISLFLLVAGMEVNLSTVWKQGRVAMTVSALGISVPFLLGLGSALVVPHFFEPMAMGREVDADPWIFALFFATALSITALPVIAKTLMDLDMYRSDLGMTIIASATFDDLTGWLIFSVILGMLGHGSGVMPVWMTISLTVGYAAVMLTLGRWMIHRSLPFIQAHLSWPAGVMGFAFTLALLGAAFTEWIGVHAIFGAFIVGVALGDSTHLRERTRTTIEQFVSFIFAPLFFASVGLRVDFAAHFDWALVLTVLAIACAGKILGCALAARMAGLPPREAWALGMGMNARGAMEIILGLLALQAGLIGERMFVALVVMALVTSMIAGPAMQRILRRKKRKRFTSFVGSRSFIPELRAGDRFSAILELVPVSGAQGAEMNAIADAVIERERVIPTGLGNGIALPHARIKGLLAPQVAMGISQKGIDFDAPDGELARIICVILTPAEDKTTALELYRDILATFKDTGFRGRALQVKTYTELLALLASGTAPNPGEATIAPATH
jgi:Kef-type K+ transport system membrane component KefB/mannitol/fructose-specific phosphotransferase system IIA component (Ntr-type)